jgi:hypothetical protein
MDGKGTFVVQDNLRGGSNAIFDRGSDVPYVEAIDLKSESTQGGGVGGGGDFEQDLWLPRDLTRTDNNDFSFLILASSEGSGGTCVIPAGEYYIEASSPAYSVGEHQLRLADVTNSKFYTTVIMGTSEYSANSNAWRDSDSFYMVNASSTQTRAFVQGRFTVDRTTSLEIQHRCTTSKGKDGFGVATGFYGPFYMNMVPAGDLYSTFNMWQVRKDDELQDGFYIGHVFFSLPVIVEPPVSGFSLEFLADESLEELVAYDLNIPNASTTQFTFSVWARRTVSDTSGRSIFGFGRGGGFNQNVFTMYHNATTQLLAAQVYADATGNSKTYTSSQTLPAVDEWFMFTMTYDGTNGADAFKLYLNATVDPSPTKGVDSDITGLTQINGSGVIGASGNGSAWADHTIFSLGIWDKELSAAEVAAVYNGKDPTNFDLRTDKGNYASSANLIDYYLPGAQASPNLGASIAGNMKHLDAEENLTDSNRTTDLPTP